MIDTYQAYRDAVQAIAAKAVELGESADVAAKQCMVATENIDSDRKALLYAAGPWPIEGRLWPHNVLRYDDRYPYPAEWPDDLYELAIESLAFDIEAAMDGLAAVDDHPGPNNELQPIIDAQEASDPLEHRESYDRYP